MKVVFSRKGFDSSFGGVPSPILPDGRILTLPIPVPNQPKRFYDIQFDDRPISDIVESLTKFRIPGSTSCHLDPDLRRDSIPRQVGWRPMFGQENAAQGHLENQGIDVGDIFLFFGWFKQTEYKENQIYYKQDAEDIHILFGWLQIGEIHRPNLGLVRAYPWVNEHPHCSNFNNWGKNNAIYLSTPNLYLNDRLYSRVPGAGIFPYYNPKLRLTAPLSSRSIWRLPSWIHPEGRKSTLSYHGARNRWSSEDRNTVLKTVGKGQEFVLNMEHYPEAANWIDGLFDE